MNKRLLQAIQRIINTSLSGRSDKDPAPKLTDTVAWVKLSPLTWGDLLELEALLKKETNEENQERTLETDS